MSKDTHEGKIVGTVSSKSNPYHYVGSGLPNVYLVGVQYTQCANGEQSAEIPCLPELLKAIAKAVVEKKAPLTGEEVRFLRKRMRIPAKNFAEKLGFGPEHYSRLENGAAQISQQFDLLVRFFYASHEKLTKVSEELVSTKWQADFDQKQQIFASKDSKNAWRVEFDNVAA